MGRGTEVPTFRLDSSIALPDPQEARAAAEVAFPGVPVGIRQGLGTGRDDDPDDPSGNDDAPEDSDGATTGSTTMTEIGGG